jgi:5'-3' exonuclease
MFMEDSKNIIIFIDGSYFCFHRYYSIVRWWKSAYPEQQDVLLNPYENDDFREKFAKTFVQTVQELPKKLGLRKGTKNVRIIVGKDCKRQDIWRNEFCENYKGTRVEDGFAGAAFFKMAYDELFLKCGVENVLSFDSLEADDCIALAIKHLIKKPHVDIYIVTSDMDYLQLHSDRVKIFDLAYKNVAEKKSSFGNAEANLFCKIVMGDASDNIQSIFKKCGPKTALKCWQDKAYFEEKLDKENARDKYLSNKKIIAFECIPEKYITGFQDKYSQIMDSWA